MLRYFAAGNPTQHRLKNREMKKMQSTVVQKEKGKRIGRGKRYRLVIADAGQHRFRCLSTKQKKACTDKRMRKVYLGFLVFGRGFTSSGATG